VGVCVCIHTRTHTHTLHMGTHTHTLHMGCLDVSPGVGTRHLEGPKDPDGHNLGIYVFV